MERRRPMALEERRRDLKVNLALHRAPDDQRLVLAGGEDRNLPRIEDRGHAHRDRLTRHILLAKEIGGSVASRDRVERDEPRAAVSPGARLIESDMPRLSDPEDLEVDSTGLLDRLLVGRAFGLDFRALDVTARDVHICPVDIDV